MARLTRREARATTIYRKQVRGQKSAGPALDIETLARQMGAVAR